MSNLLPPPTSNDKQEEVRAFLVISITIRL